MDKLIIEGGVVKLMGEGEVGILAREFEADDLAELLAPLKVILDVALDSGAVSPLLASS